MHIWTEGVGRTKTVYDPQVIKNEFLSLTSMKYFTLSIVVYLHKNQDLDQ